MALQACRSTQSPMNTMSPPASAAGMIDGIGYFGGILSGIAMGSLAQSAGWNSAMGSLGVMCAVVAIITWSILKVHSKKFAYVA
jgi:OPA family glycerol-3-phosphate transporter-like MFS transporter